MRRVCGEGWGGVKELERVRVGDIHKLRDEFRKRSRKQKTITGAIRHTKSAMVESKVGFLITIIIRRLPVTVVFVVVAWVHTHTHIYNGD